MSLYSIRLIIIDLVAKNKMNDSPNFQCIFFIYNYII